MFEENKQGFDGKGCTLTNFVALEEHMADKHLAKPSRSLLLKSLYTAILGVLDMRRINYDSATVNPSA